MCDEFAIVNGVFHYEILQVGNMYVNFAETQKCSGCGADVSAGELETLNQRGIVQIEAVILKNDNAFRGYHTFTCPKCSAKNRFKYEVRLISDIQPYIPIIDGYDLESTEGWSGNPRYIKPWLAVSR
jgi:hypothetical protein